MSVPLRHEPAETGTDAPSPLPDTETAYYTQLQGAVEEALNRVEQVVLDARPKVEADLTKMRSLHARARDLIRTLGQRVEAYERILAAIDQALDPEAEHAPVEGLRGKAIADTAIRVLQVTGHASEPIHYRRWFELVEQAGYRISGKDPYASFIVALSRHEGVEQVGNHSGLYRLREHE